MFISLVMTSSDASVLTDDEGRALDLQEVERALHAVELGDVAVDVGEQRVVELVLRR